MTELTSLKELILIKQVHQKNMTFVTIGIFQIKGFKFQQYVCNGCHDVLIMSINFKNITILSINDADYRGVIDGISSGML